jgi:cytochrome c
MNSYKIILVAHFSIFFIGCNSPKNDVDVVNNLGNNVDSVLKNETVLEKKLVLDTPISVGDSLIKSSDCNSCHLVDLKLVGPSYIDIANKYKSNNENIKLLVDKVINGGSGVWGDVPMQAHKQLSNNDAKEMILYVLSLTNK